MRLTELGGHMRMATTKPTMNPAGNSADIRSNQSMPQDGPAEATFDHMKWIPLALGLTASSGATCRFGPVQAGLLWSSQSLAGGSQRNDWVAAGAEDIQAIRMMRLRLGMTF